MILGVPMPVLRDQDITFTPEVSDAKRAAWNAVGMGSGLKVIIFLLLVSGRV